MARLSARERREAAKPLEIVISPGTTVLCQRTTLMACISSGLIPMHLLKMVAEMAGNVEGKTPIEIAAQLSDEQGVEFTSMLDRFACAVAIDPVIVMEDDGNADHLPVAQLDPREKLSIFLGVSGQPNPLDAPAQEPQLPDLSTEVARDRFSEGGATDSAAVLADGADVSNAAEPLADAGMAGEVAR